MYNWILFKLCFLDASLQLAAWQNSGLLACQLNWCYFTKSDGRWPCNLHSITVHVFFLLRKLFQTAIFVSWLKKCSSLCSSSWPAVRSSTFGRQSSLLLPSKAQPAQHLRFTQQCKRQCITLLSNGVTSSGNAECPWIISKQPKSSKKKFCLLQPSERFP